MRFFDFDKHWTRFYAQWKTDEVQEVVRDLLYVHGFLKVGEPWEKGTPLASLTGASFSHDSVESIVLPHGCHVYAPALFLIAVQLYPKYVWTLVDGDIHSTVVSEEMRVVFDLLCWYYDRLPGRNLSAIDVYEMCIGRKRGILTNASIQRRHSAPT